MTDPTTETAEEVGALLEEAYKVRINNLDRSLALTDKAFEISQAAGDERLMAQSLSKLSLFKMIKGEYEQCINVGKEAIDIFKMLGDEKGIVDAKYNIAGAFYKTDNNHQGLIYLIDCLEIYRKLNDHHNQARVQKSLGTIYEFFGDERSAILSYEKSIESARLVGDLNLESNVYNPLSGIYLNQDKIEEADKLIEKSISLKTRTGDTRGLGFALYGKAKVFVKRKEWEEAEQTFMRSKEIHTEMGEFLGIGMCLHKMGDLYVKMGTLDKAIEVLGEAIKFSTKKRISMISFKCNFLMYEIYKRKAKHTLALQYLEVYLKEKESVINTQTQKVIESYEALSTMERLQKEAQVKQERDDIIEKKNRAEQASKVRQDFLSTMSHEIRTPLNAVITITSLLEEKMEEESNMMIRSLKFSANNLMRIINDILDFSKLDAGKVELEQKPVHLSTLLINLKNTYHGLADEKGVSLDLSVDERLKEHYQLDETKLSQIMGNLISNAIKFTEKGKIMMSAQKVGQTIKGDKIRFTIEDTGSGIPEDFKSQIFDSFSQPKSYTKKQQSGSGLGLAIVKNLVELHGSSIHMESVEGEGSTFYFEILAETSSSILPVLNKNPNQLIGKKVLLAEDNMINAMVSKKLLSIWGIETTHAEDGKRAIELSKAQAYDYILMDIHMPKINGFEAAVDIRMNENPNMNAPIFALTADITAKQKAMFSPYFNGFLLKPIEKDLLYQALVDCL
ncbi:MAG: ATP-binding protein [Cyclobacteriaceae bacterium]